MGELQDGRYQADTVESIVDSLMEDAKEQFGDDLNDNQTAMIRKFYRPVAERLFIAQRDIGLVLDSSQIDHASEEALDLLTSLIGVVREDSQPATGEVAIYIDEADTVDHGIPSGTRVATNNVDGVEFEVTEPATLEAGETEVVVPIEAIEGGANTNVGPRTIDVFSSNEPFPGANVINDHGTDGGRDSEPDDELRERAKEELADGARSTAPAIVSAMKSIDEVTNVSIFVNDTSEENGRGHGLPPHSFELILSGGDDEVIAQRILDTKAAADICEHGVNGDSVGEVLAELPNGQEHPIGFSRAQQTNIYFDISLQTTEDYKGHENVRDNIVDYIGGHSTSGFDVDGDLEIGDDVIHVQIKRAIMNVDGVYDIDHVYMDRSENPTSEENIDISDNEQAYTDARDGDQHIEINA